MSTLTGSAACAESCEDDGGRGGTQRPPAPVVVLISGRGSNMMALVEHAHSEATERSITGQAGNYSVIRVISDNPSTAGLAWAQERGIDTIVLPDRSSFNSKNRFFAHLLDRVLEVQPTLVCLAGFMKVLPPAFTEQLFPKIINIHPSLLPAFPGLNTHERALAHGVTQHGCSVHLVIPEVDAGPIIAQAAMKIDANETPDLLSKRVLKKEHEIYPWVVSGICCGNITLGETVSFSLPTRADGISRGYLLPVESL